TARKAATAKSGRARASKTRARGRISSSSSSSLIRLTGSSQRSRERTEAPSCRRVATAPSSRSYMGPWPITATKLRYLHVCESANLGATNGDAGNFDGRAAHPDRDALAVFSTGPDAVGESHVVTQHGYLAQCFGPVSDKIHALE